MNMLKRLVNKLHNKLRKLPIYIDHWGVWFKYKGGCVCWLFYWNRTEGAYYDIETNEYYKSFKEYVKTWDNIYKEIEELSKKGESK